MEKKEEPPNLQLGKEQDKSGPNLSCPTTSQEHSYVAPATVKDITKDEAATFKVPAPKTYSKPKPNLIRCKLAELSKLGKVPQGLQVRLPPFSMYKTPYFFIRQRVPPHIAAIQQQQLKDRTTKLISSPTNKTGTVKQSILRLQDPTRLIEKQDLGGPQKPLLQKPQLMPQCVNISPRKQIPLQLVAKLKSNAAIFFRHRRDLLLKEGKVSPKLISNQKPNATLLLHPSPQQKTALLQHLFMKQKKMAMQTLAPKGEQKSQSLRQGPSKQPLKQKRNVRSTVQSKKSKIVTQPKVGFTKKIIINQRMLTSDIKSCMNSFLLAPLVSKKEERRFKCSNVRLQAMDPLVLYGIRLHRYANNMCEMIRVAELAIESNLIPPADAAPSMPKHVKLKQTHKRNSLNFIQKQSTPFVQGIGNMPPEISSSVASEVLGQSIAAIVGLLGYENTHQSVLDVLVDVLIDFLRKIAYHFKIAFEDEQRGWMDDFPNIAERVLVELGMGGCKGIHDYYQSRVVGYVNVLEQHCMNLNKHYQNLITSEAVSPKSPMIPSADIKLEVEEEVVEVETPQLQIMLNEELESPALDAGYQLLSSLEADT